MGKDPLKFALVRDGLVILYSEILWKLVVRSHTWAGSTGRETGQTITLFVSLSYETSYLHFFLLVCFVSLFSTHSFPLLFI